MSFPRAFVYAAVGVAVVAAAACQSSDDGSSVVDAAADGAKDATSSDAPGADVALDTSPIIFIDA